MRKLPAVAMGLILIAACDARSKSADKAALDSALSRDLELTSGDSAIYAEAADIAVDEEPANPVELISPIDERVAKPAAKPRSPAPAVEPTPAPPDRSAIPGCDSPSSLDQRRCLMGHLARSDVTLNRTYQEMIRELRSRDPGDPDAVMRLRQSQRAWLVFRDRECRQRNRGSEGELWAPVRASCLGEFSSRRANELETALQTLRDR